MKIIINRKAKNEVKVLGWIGCNLLYRGGVDSQLNPPSPSKLNQNGGKTWKKKNIK